MFLTEKRILVTGACGTIGRELVRQLLEEHDVDTGDLNWYFQPRGEVVELYSKEDPDMLIDFNTVHQC